MTYCVLSVLRSRDQLAAFAAVTLTQSLLAEGLAVGFVLGVGREARWYMLGETLAQIASALLGLLAVRPGALRRVDLAPLWAILRFSIPIVPGAVAAFVLAASDRLVVQGDLGPRAVAHYNLCSNIGGFAITILGMLEVIWLPRILAIDDRATRRQVLDEAGTALAVMVVAVAGAIALASPLLLRIWAPPSYDPTQLQWVVSIVCAAAIPFALIQLPTQALLAAGRTGVVAVLAAVAAAANLLLNLALVPRFGIQASADATLIAFGLEMALAWWFARAELAPPRVGKAGYIGVGTAAVVVSAAMPPHGAFIVVRALLTLVTIAAFAIQALRMLRPELLPDVGRAVRRLPGLSRG